MSAPMRWTPARALMMVALGLGGTATAEEPEFRVSGEIKLHYRDSIDLERPILTPFPGRKGPLSQRTADPGRSLELSTLNVRGEGEVASGVFAKVEVHVLDLHSRNPTSSDDRVLLREASVRVGDPPDPLRPSSGHGVYVLAGLAPRFSKQLVRRLESYGMWGTAIARFEQPQVQVGATLGRHAYARLQLGNGNPVFLRDTNALAGDNGTPDRTPGSPDRVYETGFPILYDAKPQDVNFDGRVEWGAGLGARWGRDDGPAADVLAWHFRRDLADAAHIRGTRLRGDLDILRGDGFPLPFEGRKKAEWGVNLQGRVRGFRVFGQIVHQDLAGLVRLGYEVELAWVKPLEGLFLVKESPFLTWVQPVVRVSFIDNRFDSGRNYPARSVAWDWLKYDLGVRVGLLRGVDLTVEYSRHDAVVRDGVIHPDEVLVTLRAGF